MYARNVFVYLRDSDHRQTLPPAQHPRTVKQPSWSVLRRASASRGSYSASDFWQEPLLTALCKMIQVCATLFYLTLLNLPPPPKATPRQHLTFRSHFMPPFILAFNIQRNHSIRGECQSIDFFFFFACMGSLHISLHLSIRLCIDRQAI